jgi:ribosome maturation factor RimP
MAAAVPENIQEAIVAKLGEFGLELFDLKFFQAGSRGVLRITIDSPDGVTISDCEKASSELSMLLDVEDFLSGRPYNLEISSPGIDRPLKTEKDFKRTIGRFVVLQMMPDYVGKKALRGKVIGCSEGILKCDIDGVITDLSLPLIAKGKEELQFK